MPKPPAEALRSLSVENIALYINQQAWHARCDGFERTRMKQRRRSKQRPLRVGPAHSTLPPPTPAEPCEPASRHGVGISSTLQQARARKASTPQTKTKV
eukprot:3430437-Rhodomonas_salina.2